MIPLTQGVSIDECYNTTLALYNRAINIYKESGKSLIRMDGCDYPLDEIGKCIETIDVILKQRAEIVQDNKLQPCNEVTEAVLAGLPENLRDHIATVTKDTNVSKVFLSEDRKQIYTIR